MIMRAVNVTELRGHLQKYLNSVQKGAEIEITLHGEVIARILPPIDTKKEAIKQMESLRKICKIGDVVSPLDEKWDANK
jgi:prevent-host-death family protein